MTLLSEKLAARVKELGLPQKDVAARFHDAHSAAVTEARRVQFESTVIPKLSRLLGGEQDGEDFFFRDSARVEALAAAVSWDAEALKTLHSRSASMTYLVLDPSLHEDVRTYFRERTPQLEGNVAAIDVLPAEGEDRRQALKRVAQERRNAIVVLSKASTDANDGAFLAGADVQFSGVDVQELGWVLAASPELVPLPPPPQPVLWSDEGQPLMPDASIPERLNWQQRERVRAYGPRGATPSFELGVWLSLWEQSNAASRTTSVSRNDQGFEQIVVSYPGPAPEWMSIDDSALAYALVSRALGEEAVPYAWCWERRIFAIGASAHLMERLREHHEVASPDAAIEVLREAIKTLNPWNTSTPAWKRVHERVRELCGVNPASGLRGNGVVGSDLEGRLKLKLPVDVRRSHSSQARRVATRDPQQVDDARKLLRSLAERDVRCELDPDSLFAFEALSEAPLRVVEPHDGLALHAIANLGAGNFADVQVLRFPGEGASAFEARHGLFEADDVRLTLQWMSSSNLEDLPLLKRRRERLASDDD